MSLLSCLFNVRTNTETYTLSLHDALPISKEGDKIEVRAKVSFYENRGDYQLIVDAMKPAGEGALLLAFQKLKERSEEHTSELQSRPHLVCRLLLEKKKPFLTSSIQHSWHA